MSANKQQSRQALLLVNLGTPASPATGDVRKYLTEFLNDERVFDIHPLARFFLVNFLIVPFRAPASAKLYRRLWTEKGSPLLFHGEDLRNKVANILPEHYDVFLTMRYGQPSFEKVLEEVRKKNYSRLTILPLYPQYASSSTGSSIQKLMKIISTWFVVPEVVLISQFYNHPGYTNTFAELAKKYNPASFDHVLFSYHGLPVRQTDKVHEKGNCTTNGCTKEINPDNMFCYRATCYETTRLIASQLQLPENKYTVAFQSRLNKNWLEPFSDKVVAGLAKTGVKKLLVFSPSFVADCLETTIEIGYEYREIFTHNGGEQLQLVESLNAHPMWVETIKDLVINRQNAV